MLAPVAVEVKTEHFQEAINGAQAAQVQLATLRGPGTIRAADDGDTLFTAEVTHIGTLAYAVEGDAERAITLETVEWPRNLRDVAYDRDAIRWTVGLSPDVPLALQVESCSNHSDFDLSALRLTELGLQSLSAGLKLALPATGAPYPVQLTSLSGSLKADLAPGGDIDLAAESISGGARLAVGAGATVRATVRQTSGSLTLKLAEGSNTTLEITYLSGGLQIEAQPNAALTLTLANVSGGGAIIIPADAAIRIEARGVSGHVNVNVPGLPQTASHKRQGGVWESAAYATAERRITIQARSVSGGLSVHSGSSIS